MKHYVNFALLFAFLVLIASAFLRFFEPFSLATTRIHILFGAFVLLLVGLHLSSRIGYFSRRLKGVKASSGEPLSSKRLVVLPLITCAYLLAACFLNWWPVPHLIALGYEARNRATIFRPESGTAIRPRCDSLFLARAGFSVSAGGTGEKPVDRRAVDGQPPRHSDDR